MEREHARNTESLKTFLFFYFIFYILKLYYYTIWLGRTFYHDAKPLRNILEFEGEIK